MKKKLIIYAVLVILIVIIIGIAKGIKTNKDNKFNITTSFYPMYIAVLNITDGIDDVTVTNLTNNNKGCLHDYTLSTSELVTLADSKVFVINGAGMETFMDKVISSYPDLKVIDSSQGIELLKEGNEDGEYNGHIFVSIWDYIKQIENITERLVKLNPKNEEKYIANSSKYIQKLTNLRQEMRETTDSLKYRNIVTFHDSFDYFADEFNLNIVGTIESEHGKNPSAGEIASLVEVIKKENVKAVFVEPEYNTSIAQTVAKEANVKLYVLNSTTTGGNNKDAYITMMKENINVLKQALN